jgi:hypothetical protein
MCNWEKPFWKKVLSQTLFQKLLSTYRVLVENITINFTNYGLARLSDQRKRRVEPGAIKLLKVF